VLYRQVNFAGTEGLAKAAAASGVRRLVFLSTIKVNGEATTTRPFSEQDIPNPQDLYADSKNEAEQFLRRISAETGLEVVILRTPLVYGAAVKANFLRLMQWVDRGIPLPLSSVKNKRSMIYLGNLVDALICCVEHPSASGKTFVVSDGEDISTADLIRKIALAMGRPARLLPCPEKMLRFLAGLAGKSQDIDRLLTSLQLDSHGIRQDLDWAPPYTLDQGVIETVNWYLQNKQSNDSLKCAV
jgi:nucleoside-diphosphate-sugar epimerase